MVNQISKNCDNCHRDGYIIQKKGSFATAEACEKCVSNCLECNGTGSVILKNQKGYTHVAMCSVCGVVRRNVKLYNVAGIPAKYYHVLQTDTFQPINKTHQHALQYAKDFVKLYPEKKGFLLMGKAGLGKTHLAIGAISELTLERGTRCLFKDFFYLLSELKEAYSLGTPENEVLRPLVETEVLVIDELGKAKSSDWELNILDQLISKRYNAEKKTLITTNYVSRHYLKKQSGENQELEERVGERIASRLYEMCEFIHLEGEDHRKVRKKV
jgi:DNA replication protein DnaC